MIGINVRLVSSSPRFSTSVGEADQNNQAAKVQQSEQAEPFRVAFVFRVGGAAPDPKQSGRNEKDGMAYSGRNAEPNANEHADVALRHIRHSDRIAKTKVGFLPYASPPTARPVVIVFFCVIASRPARPVIVVIVAPRPSRPVLVVLHPAPSRLVVIIIATGAPGPIVVVSATARPIIVFFIPFESSRHIRALMKFHALSRRVLMEHSHQDGAAVNKKSNL
jgi:hypothetical protein